MAESYYVSQHKIDESYKDGMEFGKRDMIQRMYKNDMSVSMIAKYSGMNVSEVQEIIDQRQYVLTR